MVIKRVTDKRILPHTPGVARIALYVGGNGQANVANSSVASFCDIKVYLDVSREIQTALPGDLPPNTVVRSLAHGNTVATLLSSANGRAEKLVKNRPGRSLDTGLRQHRSLGYFAAKAAIDAADFVTWVQSEILEQAMAMHGGCISRFMLMTELGGGGATGAGGALELALAISDVLLESSDAIVEIAGRVIGSLTYFGLGHRVHRNVALTAAEWLYHASLTARHERETISVTFIEYPPCGMHKQARDQIELQVTQARFCREIEDQVMRMAVNYTGDSPIGAVAIERPGFGHAIPEREVAADVCASFLPTLYLVLATRFDMDMVANLDVRRQSQPLPCLDVERIIERAPDKTVEEIMEAIKQPDEQSVAEVFLEFADGNRVNLSRCKELFSAPLDTTAEGSRRLCLLRTAEQILSHDVTLAAETLADGRNKEADKDRESLNAVKRYKQTWAFWMTWEQLEDGIRQTSVPARDCGREVGRLKAEYDALCDALDQVRGEIAHVERRLNGCIALLLQFLGSSGMVNRPAYVLAQPLDFVFSQLLNKDVTANTQSVLRLLGSAVSHATVAGLAYTLGSDSDRVEDLIALLAHGKPAMEAPAFGGRCDCDETKVTYIVVPPVLPDVELKLREGFQKSGGSRILGFAETACGGVNTVHVSLYFPQARSAVITSFLAAHARQAMIGEDYEVHLGNGFDYMKACGFPVATPPSSSTGNSNTEGE